MKNILKELKRFQSLESHKEDFSVWSAKFAMELSWGSY